MKLTAFRPWWPVFLYFEQRVEILVQFSLLVGCWNECQRVFVRFKPVFAKRDKTQTMIDIRGVSKSWLKLQRVPPL